MRIFFHGRTAATTTATGAGTLAPFIIILNITAVTAGIQLNVLHFANDAEATDAEAWSDANLGGIERWQISSTCVPEEVVRHQTLELRLALLELLSWERHGSRLSMRVQAISFCAAGLPAYQLAMAWVRDG